MSTEKGRLIQCDEEDVKNIRTNFIKDEFNPCGCGSNCFHYEYDKARNIIYGVCNVCDIDIYEVKKEYIAEELRIGKWIEK